MRGIINNFMASNVHREIDEVREERLRIQTYKTNLYRLAIAGKCMIYIYLNYFLTLYCSGQSLATPFLKFISFKIILLYIATYIYIYIYIILYTYIYYIHIYIYIYIYIYILYI